MSEITVIGSIAGKITGHLDDQLMMGQNEAKIEGSFSGTGRNIAENLGRLHADVALVAVAGQDHTGRSAKRELDETSVNTEHVTLLENENTAMNVSVINIAGELDFAIGNRDIFDKLDRPMVEGLLDMLSQSKAVLVDGTCAEETLEYIAENVKAPLFFDPETEEDAEKARKVIGKFHTIMPDRAEASAICGMDIFSQDQLMEAGKWFADQGVKRIFITMSGGGVYYKEGARECIIPPKEMKIKADTEGAGAAFSAAVLDGFLSGMDIEAQANYGMAAAAIALDAKSVVNPEMSRKKIEEYNA